MSAYGEHLLPKKVYPCCRVSVSIAPRAGGPTQSRWLLRYLPAGSVPARLVRKVKLIGGRVLNNHFCTQEVGQCLRMLSFHMAV